MRPRLNPKLVKLLVLLVASVTVACAICGCDRASEVGLNPGDIAPDFSASLLDGRLVKLSEFSDKVVLLNFWATWCGPCAAEMPSLQRLHDRFKDKGFAVLAVAVDDQESNVRDFAKQYGLTFPIALDLSGLTKRPYKISGFPESLVLAKGNKLKMIADPESRSPVVKIIGPREWDAPEALSQIERLLSK